MSYFFYFNKHVISIFVKNVKTITFGTSTPVSHPVAHFFLEREHFSLLRIFIPIPYCSFLYLFSNPLPFGRLLWFSMTTSTQSFRFIFSKPAKINYSLLSQLRVAWSFCFENLPWLRMSPAFAGYCCCWSGAECSEGSSYGVWMFCPVLLIQETCFLWRGHFLFSELQLADFSRFEPLVQDYW